MGVMGQAEAGRVRLQAGGVVGVGRERGVGLRCLGEEGGESMDE